MNKGLDNTIPALDGLRAVAALGVLITHVSFQTATGIAILERFDYFVAVFFALSAFVLWRRGLKPGYYRNRFARLAPAYLLCVTAVIALLPEASSLSLTTIVANLTATQIYFSDGLAPGLTHLWSLSIEIAFYLVLPLLVALRPRWWAIVGVAVASLGWGWIAEYIGGDVNAQIWPPAYISWFAVGMLAAECEGKIPVWCERLFRRRWIWWSLAGVCLWVASRPWFGPPGLVHPEPGEFARRILFGALFAACVVVPYALAPGGLEGPKIQALGKWSYSIFLWHVAVLAIAFPILGINHFSGSLIDALIILTFTLVVTVVISAACYELVETPAGRAIRAPKAPAHKSATNQESPA